MRFVILVALTVFLLAGCDSALVGDEMCGNGELDGNELCDTGILSGNGMCPGATDCDDSSACTVDSVSGEACMAHCEHTAITEPADDDGCCPGGATFHNDSDCPPGCGDETCSDDESCKTCETDCGVCCGNGDIDEGEMCDTAIVTGPGHCPLEIECNDGFPCTVDALEGLDCAQRCTHTAIKDPAEGDDCCPPGADHSTDSDCPIVCGDDHCDQGEDCDNCEQDCGECPPVCPADPLVPDGGTATAGESCEAAGTRTCAGHAQSNVLVCQEATCTWASQDGCTGGYLCDSVDAVCRAPVTACIGHLPGEVVCDGPERHVCGIDLVSSTVDTCDSIQLCELGQGGQCAVCLDGENRCQGAELQTCADDNMGWDPVETCASEALCNAAAGQCTDQVCVQNQYQCNDNVLEVCNAAGSGFEVVATCDPGMCDAVNGQCDICEPLAATCLDDDTRQECSSDGQNLVPTDCPVESPFCIDGGLCVQCKVDGDCPASADPCVVPVCNASVCGTRILDPYESCGPNMICDDQAACVCDYKWLDCNGLATDGCEIDIYNDADNCGACGNSCQGGECDFTYCLPVLLAANSSFWGSFALDDDYIYIGDSNAWSMLRIPKAGGSPQVVAPVSSQITGVAVDYTSVYWTSFLDISKAPKTGGSATLLANEDGDAIALDSSWIYFTKVIEGEIRKVPKSGGSSFAIATGQRYTSDDMILGAHLADIAVNDSNVYWLIDENSSGYSGWARRSDLWGDGQTDLTAADRATALAIDDDGIYWIDAGNGVFSYTFADGMVHILAEGQDESVYYSYAIAVDADYVYYPNFYFGSVYRVPKSGGSASVIMWNLNDPWTIGVDDCCVYVKDDDGLHKMVKYAYEP